MATRDDTRHLSRLRPRQLQEYVLQEHKAQRAGHHYDLRLGGGPRDTFFSWALPKGMPRPGERPRLAVPTPLHTRQAATYKGRLSGYGAGEVDIAKRGQVMVTEVGPGLVSFTIASERYPERFQLRKHNNNWLLINTTPRAAWVSDQKVRYVKVPAEKVDQLFDPKFAVQAKIDGAAAWLRLLKDEVEVASYRVSAQTGRPIVHTERMGLAGLKAPIPAHLQGSVLRGEIYAEKRDA